MAKFTLTTILCSTLLFAFLACSTARNPHPELSWFRNLRNAKEKVANVRFYVHDQVVGPNATVWEVARANITSTSPTTFGQIIVMDGPITTEPDPNSMALGRAQGVITSADLSILGFAMNVNYFFTTGKYNGSSICILGRNPFMDEIRELPVVGGTGAFRMARGFSISRTLSYDFASSGVIEHNVFVTYLE